MKSSKILLTLAAASITSHVEFASDFHGGLSGGYTKFNYAGLSKKSPSHAQQKRDAKKAKNKGSK